MQVLPQEMDQSQAFLIRFGLAMGMKARIQPKSGFWDVVFQLPVRLRVDAANLLRAASGMAKLGAITWRRSPSTMTNVVRKVSWRSRNLLNVSSSAEALSEPVRRTDVATL